MDGWRGDRQNENFSEWYSQVIVASELIDYYIWEKIQEFLDQKIKESGVKVGMRGWSEM